MKIGMSFRKERKLILDAVDACSKKLDQLLGIESPETVKRPVWRIRFRDGTEIIFRGDYMSTKSTIDAGPFNLNVDAFVDDGGNTTTDTDVPVWVSSDPTVATIAVDPAAPQGAIVTLTKKVGATQVTAAFGDQTKLNTPGNYLLTTTHTVTVGLAVSGSIELTGPGVLPDTPAVPAP
jgi:hypothetical protein